MKKLFLLSAWASIAFACGSSANNTGSNAGANRAKMAASNTEFNADTYSRSENAYTTASNSSLGNLKPFVGKTAGEIKLWENKEIDTRLRKLMGADYATMKKFWNTETPIKKFGDYLMVTGCEQHNCADNQYVIFMDMGNGNINVLHIGEGILTKDWNEYGAIDLPPPFADELAAMKSHK